MLLKVIEVKKSKNTSPWLFLFVTLDMVNLPTSLFELIEHSSLPVLVEFSAEWCGPCRVMAPLLEKISTDFKGKMLVVKVDIDKRPRIAAYYDIQAVPALLLFNGANIMWRHDGALPYASLRSLLQSALADNFFHAS